MDSLTIIPIRVQAFRIKDAMILDVVSIDIPALDNDRTAAKIGGVFFDIAQLTKSKLALYEQRLR